MPPFSSDEPVCCRECGGGMLQGMWGAVYPLALNVSLLLAPCCPRGTELLPGYHCLSLGLWLQSCLFWNCCCFSSMKTFTCYWAECCFCVVLSRPLLHVWHYQSCIVKCELAELFWLKVCFFLPLNSSHMSVGYFWTSRSRWLIFSGQSFRNVYLQPSLSSRVPYAWPQSDLACLSMQETFQGELMPMDASQCTSHMWKSSPVYFPLLLEHKGHTWHM